MVANTIIMANVIDVKNMLGAAVHFGHKTSSWHPKMAPYLYGSQRGIHIIDLYKSKAALENALEFISKLAKEGKTVLFVATKPQASSIVRDVCEKAGVPHVTHKWVAGLLTNFQTVKSRIKFLQRLKEDEATGALEKFTKKEAAKMKKDAIKLGQALGGLGNMTSLPDAVVVFDAVKDRLAITEATTKGLPVVAICDSNADPEGIQFVVPGNDDSMQSIELFANAFVGALKSAK